MKNYNHYNLNPPEPIVFNDSETDREEEALIEAIEAHLYEEPENRFSDTEQKRINELINNESDQAVQ